ncbi:hypothetical protein FJY94_06235 [Candidatus Kaiserbacteria bacterium]|nr:hypothetical protein [Candidatus Kaiserbacteria bacterium]
MTRRRLPAFAAELAAARHRGLVPRHLGFGYVAVVLNWDNHATAGLHRIVLPPNVELATLDLGCLAGLHVLLTHTETESARAAAAVDALLAAGVWRIDAANLDAIDRGDDLAHAWPVFNQEGIRHAA